MKYIGGIFDLHFFTVYIDFCIVAQAIEPGLAKLHLAIKHHGAVGLVYACRVAADLPVALRYLNIAIQQSHVVGEGFRGVGIDQQRSLLPDRGLRLGRFSLVQYRHRNSCRLRSATALYSSDLLPPNRDCALQQLLARRDCKAFSLFDGL